MSDVFISYSRTDSDFVRRLFDALSTSQRDTWVDWRGIDYSTKWWEEIIGGIEGADNFVLILSADALQSVYCHREIEHARRQNKRIVPVLYKPIDEAAEVGAWYTNPKMRPYEQVARANWETIKSIQWIDVPRLGDFDKVVRALLGTVDVDVERVKMHTRLLLRIREWESRGRSPDAVLRGKQLEDYERWQRTSDQDDLKPRPTDEQRTFIAESRRLEDEERAYQARRERRTRQFRIAAVLLGIFSVLAVIAAAGLGVVGAQTGNALATATIRQGQAQVLADAANGTAERANLRAQAANTQVELVGQTLTPIPATLTPIPVTLTAVGRKVEAVSLQAQAVDELRKAGANDPTGGNNDFIALLAIRALKYAYYPVADQALMQAAENLPLRAFRGHGDIVYNARFSPGDRYVLTAGRDGTARLWDARTGNLERTFDHRTASVKPVVIGIAFSPDGRTIATTSNDHLARLWDTATGSLVRTLSGHRDAVLTAAFSPDGKYLLTGSQDRTARLWDVNSGQTVRAFTEHTDIVFSVAFSPDGQFALTGSNDATARLWNVESGQTIRIFNSQRGAIFGVAFSPDGQRILTGGDDRTAQVVNVTSGEVLASFRDHTSAVTSVTFSPDGLYALTGSEDKTARLWDATSGKLIRSFSGHTDGVLSVAYSHDGQHILTAGYDGIPRVWEVKNTELTQAFRDLDAPALGLAVSPDGKYALAGSAGNAVSLWDLASKQVLRVFSGHTGLVLSVAFSPDGRYVLTGSADNTARLWEVATGQSIQVYGGHQNYVISAIFSPDGQHVLTGSWDGTARLWNIADQKIVRTFADPNKSNQINSVAFSPDGRYILAGVGGNGSGNGDKVARLWDAASGQLVRTFSGHASGVDSVAFSPDGRLALTGSRDWTARLWDVSSGSVVQVLQGHTDSIISVAFSPDGRTVLTGSSDKTARLWDAASGQSLRTFVGNGAEVVNVAYRPDGRTVLTKSTDGTVRLWEVDYRDFVDRICSWLVRDFTEAERASVGIVDHDSTCPPPAKIATAVPTPSLKLPVWTPIASPTAVPLTATPPTVVGQGQLPVGDIIYGPVSGELDPNASDPHARQQISQVSTKNFVAQVHFTVPRASTSIDENYSFLFRLTVGGGYAMTVYQDGAWALYTTEKTVAEGTASPTALAPGSQHTMRLEVLDERGVLYFDGIRVAITNVSEIQTSGDVRFTVDQGDKVPFDNFTIWSIP